MPQSTPADSFGDTPTEWLEHARTLRDPDADDYPDDRIAPGSSSWVQANNRKHTARHLPPRYATAGTSSPAVYAWVRSVLSEPAAAKSLLLTGPTGVGKTHTAFGALRLIGESRRSGLNWVALSTPELLGRLRRIGDREPEALFHEFASAPLLLLDDLGSSKVTEWAEDTLYRLVDHRYMHCLPSIFTANANRADLAERLGERCGSRLYEMCERVALIGPDRRRSAA